uniref:CONSTANS-like 3 n=1 Tax=Physcomitrium patens TaxID=3218 RepID=Q4W1E8_PHYPA|nr:CONSTANS-like 3 [Physcomitrium patens]
MPKSCDACQASSAVVYCRADAAYLCLGCDGKVHGANKLASRHERLWMCEVCEVAAAVVTCKADAASLCVSCDTDIHSANPLAQRHERVPVQPLFDCVSQFRGTHFSVLAPKNECNNNLLKGDEDPAVAEAVSWLLPHPKTLSSAILRGIAAADEAPAFPFRERPFSPKLKKLKVEQAADIYSDVDPFLVLDGGNGTGFQPDSLVPVHIPEGPDDSPSLANSTAPSSAINFRASQKSGCSYGTSTLTHSMSCSSVDAAVVPDSSLSDISTPYSKALDSQDSQDLSGALVPHQASKPIDTVDREARVMRCKEKRQKRKFEKTIRYASRKAYAESRPRIKGRFTKRTDSDVEQMFSSCTADSGFGVVPSSC